jgi:outer membrane protein OmpA-like peptidoglycan-associated protein
MEAGSDEERDWNMHEEVLERSRSAMGDGAAIQTPDTARHPPLAPPAVLDLPSQSRRLFLFLLFLASGAVILSSWHVGSPEVKRAERMPASAGLNLRSIELPGDVKLVVPRRGFIDSFAAAASSADPSDDSGPFIFDRLEFAAGSADVVSSSTPQLEEFATVLQAFPQISITVEGHTDNVGMEAANQKLSAERAQAVKGKLVALGITAARVTTIGYGSTRPIAGNGTDEGRARNRRVQIAITTR